MIKNSLNQRMETEQFLDDIQIQNLIEENYCNNQTIRIFDDDQFEIKQIQHSSQLNLTQQQQQIMKYIKKPVTSNFLLLQIQRKRMVLKCYLFDKNTGLHTIISGMKIKISGETIFENNIIFSDQTSNNYFVLEPEILIAPTTLASLNYCRRKKIIQEIVYDQTFSSSIPLIQGSIIHEFFQDMIKNPHQYIELFNILPNLKELQNNIDDLTLEQIPNIFSNILKNYYIENIKKIQSIKTIKFLEFIRIIYNNSINCIQWIYQYILLKEELVIKYINHSQQEEYRIQFIEWKNNEEKYSNSIYGFTGVVDIVAEINFTSSKISGSSILIPIELKTGRYQDYYDQQVQIYLFLMQKRLKKEIPFGIILYLETLQTKIVKFNKIDQQNLFFQRNLYTAEIFNIHQQENQFLHIPQLNDYIQQTRDIETKCGKCSIMPICYGLNILYSNQEPYIKNSRYEEIKSKIEDQQFKEYLNTMLKYLREEELQNKIPIMNFTIRQLQKFQNTITICSTDTYFFQDAQSIKDQCFQLKKISIFHQDKQQSYYFNIKNAIIKVSENINLENLNIENAIINNTENYIILELEGENIEIMSQFQLGDQVSHKPFKILIEKHLKHKLLEFVTNQIYDKKKNLIILGQEPEFYNESNYPQEQQQALKLLEQLKNNLADQQYQIIKQTLLAKDYIIYIGKSKSGKSLTLCYFLFILIQLKKKALIYAISNQILDETINLFQMLFPQELFKCCRLTKNQQYKPFYDIQKIVFNFNEDKDEFKQNILEFKYLFFSTCDECKDLIQSQYQFDYCILEDASKITEPLSVACIERGNRFILIGNPEQIAYSKTQNLKQSLFSRLLIKFNNHQCCQTFTQEVNTKQIVLKKKKVIKIINQC